MGVFLEASVASMAGSKPTAAFVLGLIGGIFILINAIAFYIMSSFLNTILGGMGGAASGAMTMINTLQILLWVAAFGVLLPSILLFVKTEMHKIWGALILVFSIVSLAGGGGFFIGFILGLIGGILGITFKGGKAPTMMGQ
jgi:hypothetical protein